MDRRRGQGWGEEEEAGVDSAEVEQQKEIEGMAEAQVYVVSLH